MLGLKLCTKLPSTSYWPYLVKGSLNVVLQLGSRTYSIQVLVTAVFSFVLRNGVKQKALEILKESILSFIMSHAHIITGSLNFVFLFHKEYRLPIN